MASEADVGTGAPVWPCPPSAETLPYTSQFLSVCQRCLACHGPHVLCKATLRGTSRLKICILFIPGFAGGFQVPLADLNLVSLTAISKEAS